MSHFDAAFNDLLGVEGDFSDDPADSGGATRFGVTEVAARKAGYMGRIDQLPLSVARAIYRAEYWDAIRLDDVAALSLPVALEIFDTGVNCGVATAASFLQRSLNVLNNVQAHYLDVEHTSTVGPKTLDALRAFLNRRAPSGEKVLLRALNCLQGARYIRLAETREKDERFVYGWLLQRVRV